MAFDQGRYLASYERMIAEAAEFPPRMDVFHVSKPHTPVPAGFPGRDRTWEQATAVLTGHDAARDVQWIRTPTRRVHSEGASQ